MKKIKIAGGTNGVGKTTFAYQFRDEYKIDYPGADEIAAGIDKGRNAGCRCRHYKMEFDCIKTAD